MTRDSNFACEPKVYVVGGGYDYIKMFYSANFLGARSVAEADVICFTGGEDVDPDLYGEKALNTTYFNRNRDDKEREIYAEAVILGKPMIGICRGAQFLNVMNGGKLWQHVNHHGVARGHSILDLKTGEYREGMTSTHHQQMIAHDDGEILALACESTFKQSADNVLDRKNPDLDDVEVVWYPSTLSLCFQPHPEYREGSCQNYFMELVDEYIVPAT